MVDYRIELVMVPVSDIDVARTFYGTTLGWPIDHDQEVDESVHFIQVTPPGSAASIAFGRGISPMEPGSQRGIQVVVDDIEAAHADLTARGVDVTAIDDLPWGRFVFFRDPDGNAWTVQQLPERPSTV